MLSQCVHCEEKFDFSASQLEKLEAALAKLKPGKHLRFKCPHCGLSLDLLPDGTAATGQKKDDGALHVETEMQVGGHSRTKGMPMPPDVSWLSSGQFEKRGVVEDVPLALILVEDGGMKTTIAEAFVGMSYRPVFSKTVEKALESMRFVQYAAIVFQLELEGKSLSESVFHAYMRRMEMARRRNVFYTLIDPSFKTLYDLEALSASANLVVNNKDVPHIATIINKSMQDYDALFGSFKIVLKEHGKL